MTRPLQGVKILTDFLGFFLFYLLSRGCGKSCQSASRQPTGVCMAQRWHFHGNRTWNFFSLLPSLLNFQIKATFTIISQIGAQKVFQKGSVISSALIFEHEVMVQKRWGWNRHQEHGNYPDYWWFQATLTPSLPLSLSPTFCSFVRSITFVAPPQWGQSSHENSNRRKQIPWIKHGPAPRTGLTPAASCSAKALWNALKVVM